MHRLAFATLVTRIVTLRNIIGGAVIVGGIAISALGMLKVPAQQQAIAAKLDEHSKAMADGTTATNRRLDVLICLQAKLDTPINCVARGSDH